MPTVTEQALLCKGAAPVLAALSTGEKNAALEAVACALERRVDDVLAANARDLAAGQEGGMSEALLDRLALTPARVAGIVAGVRQVAALPDPVGKLVHGVTLPNGLCVTQVRVPLGVVGVIFEARPNVTVDVAALCLKSGNAALLRGGKEARHSSLALGEIMAQALAGLGLPAGCVQVVDDPSREGAAEMMGLTGVLDVLIPRGGKTLIRTVVEHARVPVIRTGEGVCHLYVDAAADAAMATDLLINAKCSRPSVCNAVECVLVHRDAADAFWAAALPRLTEEGVALRCDGPTLARLRALPAAAALSVAPADEADWDTEYGARILACREVGELDEALAFIAAHGTGHSEAIVTTHYAAAERFLNEVDAAAVYVNASTRFTDGGEFGLGAEIGISTQKLHARGPMGLEALTSTKFLVRGSGQTRP